MKLLEKNRRALSRLATGSILATLVIATLFLTGCASGVKDTRRTFNTVVIDAGHGGHDSGAISNGIAEKNVALDVALRLEKHLQTLGFKTVMTRSTDVFIPLNGRADISNRQRNAIFVSIHFNCGRRSAHGAEVYYHSPESASIADAVYIQIAPLLGGRGVKTANFRVLKRNNYPAILVECCYLTNRSDAAKAKQATYRHDLAEKIADGLVASRRRP